MQQNPTAPLQVSFDRHGCKPFFKKHTGQTQIVSQKIINVLNRELGTGMTKIKLATEQKIAGHPCYELRLNLGTIGSARIAFTVYNRQVRVIFITSQLQKATFTHDLKQILKGVSL